MPSIENSISDEIKNHNEMVNFLCTTVGEPVPRIIWYFNSVSVQQNSSKYLIVSRSLNKTTTESTLSVYNITSSDVGSYICESMNSVGKTSKFGILTVTSKFLALIESRMKLLRISLL